MKRHSNKAGIRRTFATNAALAAIATLFVCTAGTASAQDAPPPPPQGGGQFGPGGPGGQRGPGMLGGPGPMGMIHTSQLVNRPDVGKDLGITEDQRQQFRDVMDKARENMGTMMPPSGEDGEGPDPKQIRAVMERFQSAVNKEINKVLTSAQRSRIKEIKVQLAGSAAVLDSEIAAQIKVTSDQKSKIDEIMKAHQPPMGGPGGGPGGPGFGGPGAGGPPGGGFGGGNAGGPPRGGFGGGQAGGPPGGGFGGPGGGPGGPGGPGGNPEMRARQEKARKELSDAIDAVLTSDQKSALKAMAGSKKFVEQMRPQRGQGGPGGGPGAGGPPPGGGFGGGK